MPGQLRPTGPAPTHKQGHCLRINGRLHILLYIILYIVIYADESLDAFLDAFAAGTFPKANWTHAAHVTMAACYLQMYPQPEATRRIREGIRHYNECQGTPNTADSGYHETLTLFWIAQATHQLAQCRPEL